MRKSVSTAPWTPSLKLAFDAVESPGCSPSGHLQKKKESSLALELQSQGKGTPGVCGVEPRLGQELGERLPQLQTALRQGCVSFSVCLGF